MVKKSSENNEAATQLAKVLWYYGMIPNVNQWKYKIVCPFHDDINASLLVNLEDGSWFCFGCNESGNAVNFVKLMEKKYNKLNDLKAYMKFYEILKSDKCSDIVIDTTRERKGVKPKKQLYDEAYDYYHGLKAIDWDVNEEAEVIVAKEYMLKRGFSPKTLTKCKAKITYNKAYSIMFPITDNGKFRGWVCRTMIKDIEKYRKYLYNEGFSRATTVVGDYGKAKYAIVVEGYMDRLKFIENGVEENVVAIFGWKMALQQEAKLKASGVEVIISALDNDECGHKGTKYLKKIFGESNVIRWSYLKGVKDPGEAEPHKFKQMYDKTMAVYQSRM